MMTTSPVELADVFERPVAQLSLGKRAIHSGTMIYGSLCSVQPDCSLLTATVGCLCGQFTWAVAILHSATPGERANFKGTRKHLSLIVIRKKGCKVARACTWMPICCRARAGRHQQERQHRRHRTGVRRYNPDGA